MIALAHGRGAHGPGIGAGVRLRLREGGRLLAAQNRKKIFLLLRRIKREQHRSHIGAEHARSARRESDGARDLLPNHNHAQEAEALTAILGGHVEQPKTKLLRLALEIGANLGTHPRTVHGIHFDRNELPVDERPHRILEQLQFFRKLEVHVGFPLGLAPYGIEYEPCWQAARQKNAARDDSWLRSLKPAATAGGCDVSRCAPIAIRAIGSNPIPHGAAALLGFETGRVENWALCSAVPRKGHLRLMVRTQAGDGRCRGREP